MNGQDRVVGLRELLREAPPIANRDAAPVAVDPAAELDALRRKVLDEAREAGYAAGQSLAKDEIGRAVAAAVERVEAQHATTIEELARAREAFLRLATGIDAALDTIDARTENAAATLAVAALTRMLGGALGDGSGMRALCQQALRDVRQRPATLRVAADDLASINDADWPDDVRIEGDARLARGTCRIESHRGVYETGLSERLHAVVDALCAGGDGA